MNIIEAIRKQVVEDLFKAKTVRSCWSVWQDQIIDLIGENPTPQSVLALGDHLREIFKSTTSKGRGQGALSGGGTAWEGLITWYINMCCAGSRVVAIKKMGQVPTPIRDAITVNYSNFKCTSESDITIVVFPNEEVFTQDNNKLFTKKGKIDFKKVSEQVGELINKFEVGIVQCKTNWNDNAQIPMLWDMIYSAGGWKGRQISVGFNNYSIEQLPTFTYSFVTVPSNKLSLFKSDAVCVKRVYNISGGNYWGLPTENGVARSVKEIFQNYRSGYEHQDIRRTLQIAVEKLSTTFAYFNLKEPSESTQLEIDFEDK